MLELEFLGIQPDGNTMTLNDSDGNRYSLPITDELRGALRRDRVPSPTEEPKPMSPRDIQAHFRAGRSLEELSELTNMPISQLSPYEYPILAEREYAANQARAYRIGHEIGSLTVEELVTSRLKSRDVNPEAIEWDAKREVGKSWELTATYTVAGRETRSVWTINQSTSSLTALNDEARWLSETEIPVKDSPWRPLAPSPASSPSRVEDEDVVLQSAETSPEAKDDSGESIVSMLDTLSARRGTKQPIVMEDDEFPPAAHPPASRPEEATDATILSLPPRPSRASRSASAAEPTQDSMPSAATAPGAEADSEVTDKQAEDTANETTDEAQSSPSAAEAEATTETAKEENKAEGKSDEGDTLFSESTPPKPKKKRGGNRPAMPSWDEIVFGHPKK